jgi:hypothetical protein
MTFGEVVTQYVIPILSMIVSVAFGVYGYTSSQKADQTLAAISKMMESWQNELMKSTIELIQSTPSVRESRIFQTKIEAVQNLAETIKFASEEIVKNPKTGDEDIPRQAHLARLMEQQGKLLKDLEQNRNA